MERPQMILAASAAVAVCIAGYFGYDAMNVSAEAAAKREEAEQLKGDVERVYSEKVFPSKDNIDRLKSEYSVIDSLRSDVTNELGKLVKEEIENLSPSQFIDSLRKLKAKWVKDAPVVEGEKCVAADFAFGFEKYVTGDLPEEANVPRLGQQMLIVNTLVNELYGAKVTKITSLVREGFDGGASQVKAADDEEQGGRRNRRNRKNKQQNEETVQKSGAGVTSVRHRLFTAQHFTVGFNARQAALVDVLNRLAKAKIFAIVTDISVKKGGTGDVRIPVEPAKKDDGASRGRRAKGQEAEGAVVEAEFSELPAGSRLMSGPDLDPLLEVVLELDVYNFAEGK